MGRLRVTGANTSARLDIQKILEIGGLANWNVFSVIDRILQ